MFNSARNDCFVFLPLGIMYLGFGFGILHLISLPKQLKEKFELVSLRMDFQSCQMLNFLPKKKFILQITDLKGH